MHRRALLRNASALSAVALLPAIVPSPVLGAVSRPVNIVVERVVPYATLVIRIPDINDCAEYTPGNLGEIILQQPDGTSVDLVERAKQMNILNAGMVVGGNTVRARTNAERMVQVLDWFRASGVFSAGYR